MHLHFLEKKNITSFIIIFPTELPKSDEKDKDFKPSPATSHEPEDEHSRPPSVLSHTTNQDVDAKDTGSRKPSLTMHEKEIDVKGKDSKSPSPISPAVEDKEGKESRPESVASNIRQKLEETDSRPASVQSHTTEKDVETKDADTRKPSLVVSEKEGRTTGISF